jgi:SAM-dependent methyltransferase
MVIRNEANDGVGTYVAWKQWGDRFGVLSRGDAKYFARELREATRGRDVRRVLEIGYGNGIFLGYARSQGWRVTGTELQPELIKIADAAGFDARPAEDLDALPDGEYDLIVALDVFEHIPPDQSIEFLRGLAQKLSAGGRIVLRFPNADSWIGNPFQNGDVTHVNAIGGYKMSQYAVECELEVVRFRAETRRGFETSVAHGVYKYTGGVVAKIVGGVLKVLYFPTMPVVMSTSNVVCVLRRSQNST